MLPKNLSKRVIHNLNSRQKQIRAYVLEVINLNFKKNIGRFIPKCVCFVLQRMMLDTSVLFALHLHAYIVCQHKSKNLHAQCIVIIKNVVIMFFNYNISRMKIRDITSAMNVLRVAASFIMGFGMIKNVNLIFVDIV